MLACGESAGTVVSGGIIEVALLLLWLGIGGKLGVVVVRSVWGNGILRGVGGLPQPH